MIGSGKNLNDVGRWMLFRGMVCNALDARQVSAADVADFWHFSEALDWSFAEVQPLPLEQWQKKIDADADAFVTFLADSSEHLPED